MGKKFLRFLGFALLIAALIAGLIFGISYALLNNAATQGKYRVDSRPCSADVGDYKLTGVREYKYYEREFFGYRIIDTRKVEEVTYYNLPNADFKIVGVNHDGTYKDHTHRPGDTGRLPIDAADTYVFFLNGKVGTATYSAFCK